MKDDEKKQTERGGIEKKTEKCRLQKLCISESKVQCRGCHPPYSFEFTPKSFRRFLGDDTSMFPAKGEVGLGVAAVSNSLRPTESDMASTFEDTVGPSRRFFPSRRA